MSDKASFSVPPIEKYFPMNGLRTPSDLDDVQKEFYKRLDEHLLDGRGLDVEGHLSYVYLHVEATMRFAGHLEHSLTRLPEYFRTIRDTYPAMRDFALRAESEIHERHSDPIGAWEIVRQSSPISFETVVRLSKRADVRLRGEDLLHMTGAGKMLTRSGQSHLVEVTSVASGILDDLHEREGCNVIIAMFKSLGEANPSEEEVRELLDACDFLIPEDDLRRVANRSTWFGLYQRGNPNFVDYYADYAMRGRLRWVMRQAENVVRQSHGLPEVGGGWVSETLLFNELQGAFPAERIVQHARPRWLAPQHLDVFLPDRNIAVEYQGDQHVRPVALFGGAVAFEQQKIRDARKRDSCAEAGCTLIEVFPGYIIDDVVEAIEKRLADLRCLDDVETS